jgi:translation initiation factor IF-2
MRSYGASIADMAVLMVAADDGVCPHCLHLAVDVSNVV